MRTPQAPEGLGPDLTQAFLLDSASDRPHAGRQLVHHHVSQETFFVP